MWMSELDLIYKYDMNFWNTPGEQESEMNVHFGCAVFFFLLACEKKFSSLASRKEEEEEEASLLFFHFNKEMPIELNAFTKAHPSTWLH